MNKQLEVLKKLRNQLEKNSNMEDVNCGNRRELTVYNPMAVISLLDRLENLLK